MIKKNISSIFTVILSICLVSLSFISKAQADSGGYTNSMADYQAKSIQKLGLTIEQPNADQLRFKAVVSNPAGKKLIVQVIDRLNGVVSSKEVDQKLVSISYDFTNAPDGEYLVRVRCGKIKVSEKILIQTVVREERVAVYNKTKNEVFKGF